MTKIELLAIAKKKGTPVVVIDHDIIRRNYAEFRKHLPKVQAYFAVKANPAPEIVRTLYKAGASFDVASLPEFMLVYENIRHLPAQEQQDFIWDKIIYANPTKPKETLQALDHYKPLVTYDNLNELKKIKQFAPHAGVVLRLRVANTGSQCELSSKFGCDTGEAVDLVLAALKLGLVVEGLSFHVGSQCTNFENFVQALNIAAAIMKESKERGHEIKILDIGGGFPAAYDKHVRPFSGLARKINAEIDRLFPKDIQGAPPPPTAGAGQKAGAQGPTQNTEVELRCWWMRGRITTTRVYSRCWCSKATTYEDENYSGGCGHVQGGSGLGARSGTGAATGGTNRHATLHFQRRARGESEPAVRGQLRTARGTIGEMTHVPRLHRCAEGKRQKAE